MAGEAALCSDCGICCDGTLFSSVSLDAAGVIAARTQRLPMLESADGYRLSLPCAALRGVSCGVYEQRPGCCADYECELRIRVAERGLALDHARRIIEETRATRNRVTAAVGDRPWWTAHHAAIEAARQSLTWARDNAELLADLETLDRLVRRHFWG